MDLIRLRTMTFKSVLDTMKFGKGKTVQNIIDAGKRNYLVYLYYCNQYVSFVPEVLKAIGIKDGDTINKPGIDREKYEEMKERITNGYSIKIRKHRDKAEKEHNRYRAYARMRETFVSRESEMYRNQNKVW